MKTNFNIFLKTWWQTNRSIKNQIIKLTQVKCDYVTISGQFGVEKLIQDNDETFTQEFQDQKTEEPRAMLFKKYKNQIKISLELTRKQAQKLWSYYCWRKKHKTK